MRLIVGLGNPGPEYVGTRHNAGWALLDRLVAFFDAGRGQMKFLGQTWGPMFHQGQRFLLLKPMTYMNASGQAVGELVRFYDIDPADVLVLSDDVHLAPGRLRFRLSGSAGGHNGLKSIMAHLGTDGFPRLRLGVGAKPAGADLADHVLSRPSGRDRDLEAQALDRAESFCVRWLTEEPGELMAWINGFRPQE